MDIFSTDTAGTRGLFFPTNLKNMLICFNFFFLFQYFVVIKTAPNPTAPKDGISLALFSLPQQIIRKWKRLIRHKRKSWGTLGPSLMAGLSWGHWQCRMEAWHRLQHTGVLTREEETTAILKNGSCWKKTCTFLRPEVSSWGWACISQCQMKSRKCEGEGSELQSLCHPGSGSQIKTKVLGIWSGWTIRQWAPTQSSLKTRKEVLEGLAPALVTTYCGTHDLHALPCWNCRFVVSVWVDPRSCQLWASPGSTSNMWSQCVIPHVSVKEFKWTGLGPQFPSDVACLMWIFKLNSFNWQPCYFQSLSQHIPLCFPVWWDLDFPTLLLKWKHIVHLHFIYLFGTKKQDTAITLKCWLLQWLVPFWSNGFS